MIWTSAYEYLKIEVAERVATVTINRPDQLNAVHAALHHELEQIWLDLAQDCDVNAITSAWTDESECLALYAALGPATIPPSWSRAISLALR